MEGSATEYRKKLMQEIKGLPFEKIREVMDFVYFIKAKDAIDPEQTYFWTKIWQGMEHEADMDKRAGNIIGNGTLENLLQSLKK